MGDVRAEAHRAIVHDVSGRITVDVPCGGCGYNLRTIEVSAVCPECAQPVASAIDKYLARLCFASPEWLKGLVTGGVWLIAGVPFAAVASLVLSFAFQYLVILPALRSGTFGPGTLASAHVYGVLIAVATLAAITPALLGIWKLTAPEPGGAAGPDRARRTTRTALGVGLFVYVLSLTTSLLNPNPAMPPFTRPTGTLGVALSILNVVLGIAFQLAAGVCVVALLLHLTALLRRFERQGVAVFGRVVLFGVSLTTVLLIVTAVVAAVAAFTLPMSAFGVVPTTLPVTLPTTLPATLPTTLPATLPAVIAAPAPPSFVANLGMISGCAGCAVITTAIAGYIFVIMGTLAFSRAREAAEATAALLAAQCQTPPPAEA